ncbi:MAG: hypothetical protein ABI699_06455 [Caldimonas sp.]
MGRGTARHIPSPRRTDGVALSWGLNNYGQLGGGPTAPSVRATPGPVLGLTNVMEIAVGRGRGHGLAVLADGTVWSWGNNGSGQLGDGTGTSRSTPVPASGLKLQ